MADPMVEPIIPTGTLIKTYHGLFTQIGTDNPIVTVYHNTIGNFTWTRIALGVYVGSCPDLYGNSKILIPPWGGADSAPRIPCNPVSNLAVCWAQLIRDSETTITMRSYLNQTLSTLKEWSTGGGEIAIMINLYKN